MTEHQPTTHELYLQAVRDVVIVIALALERGTITASQAEQLAQAELLYGVRDGSYRGRDGVRSLAERCRPVDVVEIAATGHESWIQLAGTVIHDLLTALA
jgi:hypothetical protein